MKTAIIVCCWLLAATAGLLASENTKPCTKQDSMRADAEAASLNKWTEVYRAYKQFAQCDEAGIGEGYSESIARLLSEQWGTANQLNRFILHDKGFEKFVLRHVDELMTPDQADTIRKNAEARCPPDAKRLCEKIAARVRHTGP